MNLLDLNSDDLIEFKSALEHLELKKGSFFVSPGQISRYVALIETGYLRTYHLDQNGEEVTTEFSQPGSFCGAYYSFYLQTASFEHIEAITDCNLQLISFNSLQGLYSHSLAINIFGRKVLEKACIDRDLRLKKIMHLSAKERYQWFLATYADVYSVAKLGHIASFLGMTQETLSRVRRP